MLASEVRRGTVLGGVRVMWVDEPVQNGQRVVRMHLEDGTTRTAVRGAGIQTVPTRRLNMDAAVVRAPKRTEIVDSVEQAQTPRGNGRRGVTSRRNP